MNNNQHETFLQTPNTLSNSFSKLLQQNYAVNFPVWSSEDLLFPGSIASIIFMLLIPIKLGYGKLIPTQSQPKGT